MLRSHTVRSLVSKGAWREGSSAPHLGQHVHAPAVAQHVDAPRGVVTVRRRDLHRAFNCRHPHGSWVTSTQRRLLGEPTAKPRIPRCGFRAARCNRRGGEG